MASRLTNHNENLNGAFDESLSENVINDVNEKGDQEIIIIIKKKPK